MHKSRIVVGLALALAAGGVLPVSTMAQEGGEQKQAPNKPDFPSWKEVSDGFEQKVSPDGEATLYGLWVKEKDGSVMVELPRGWQNQKHLVALTVPRGEIFAGLQMSDNDRYVYWKRFDKRMALVEPQTARRSTGDAESKMSVANHFTDRVILDVPIVCMGPNGQPVVDLKNLLVGNASIFYGRLAQGANTRLATLTKAKSFPQNFVVNFEMPVSDGTLKTFSYSISTVPDNSAYKPRKADERVGYFTTTYQDLGKFKSDEVWTRYINRWHLEKADAKLKMSPPKEPITFYLEHTFPIRYRRWVKEGVLHWNKAFEKVGIVGAIEVVIQDKETGAHMEKDPEDVRYNFIRFLSNNIGTAVGPHRSHPLTGQILDADIVLTDGWIRHFWTQSNELLPQNAMEGMSVETLEWLAKHPKWDPRVRMAPAEKRPQVMAQIQKARAEGLLAYGGRAVFQGDAAMMASPELQELFQIAPDAGVCMAAHGKAMDMAVAGLSLEVLGLLEEERATADEPDSPEPKKDGETVKKPDEKKEEGDVIDGIPEWFLGPMLADLTCHEVGHTLGLRHNFRASSIYSLKEINSKALKGQKAFAGSVMDYIPVNIYLEGDGEVQGDYTMIGVGPYDVWAIEYGYTFNDPKDVLKRVSEPELTYGTDEDTGGPDPLARRYDFAADPRDYAESRLKLAKFLRERILEKFVKDGESWSKARRGYQTTLDTQTNAVNIMASWLGGAFVNRDRKGDSGNRNPINPVPVAQQRAALKFVIDNSFYDASFGLTPELLQKMTVDKWDQGGVSPYTEPTWPVHDRIMGIQASALTMLMNPTTLRRVYDNEFLIPRDQDALTLPEMMDTISAAVWSELDGSPDSKYSERQPMLSSLRRNLQREHMERLIDLSMESGMGAASKPIANLATMKLREISGKIGKTLKNADKVDSYSVAHLTETKMRIDKALDAGYIYNMSSGGGGFGGGMFFMGEGQGQPAPGSSFQQDDPNR